MNFSVVSVVGTLTGLAQNLALLLSLTLLYSVIRPYMPKVPRAMRQAASGVLFALIAIAAKHTPFIIEPGVIADARVIPVLLAGPFGGPGAALTAAMVAAGYRAWLGGLGSAAGVRTILTAGLLGMAVTWWWRRRGPHRQRQRGRRAPHRLRARRAAHQTGVGARGQRLARALVSDLGGGACRPAPRGRAILPAPRRQRGAAGNLRRLRRVRRPRV